MLKGGLVVNASGPVELYFESGNFLTEIWVDSISLQPFTCEEWNSHQEKSIQKVRKGKVKFRAIDEQGRPISNATISIKQIRPDFPFGCAINNFILEHPAYEKWFTSRFKYTVFENELKWTTTEPYQRGYVNYTLPDSLLRFTKSHGLTARGHTVLWGSRGGNPI
ncbi:Endo-1,4-beta-xylanase 5 [Sesamum alatum]|uniref:Endo-1,4-beta-xylanase 5 n=1 Tax=Sesamum alatum TaxID=300844 RepID=A0AAE1YJ95_9LAMI|nr:Endo-1,4-beta-xylanase 5 [Sesamum alatum]